MVAVVQVDTRPAAKGNKATEEDRKTPPPPPPPEALRRRRQPTPDHPPYCWMIGEAIDALGEDGGSAEGPISGFIRARHPGVPAAHDRLLRHYLAKHVAEGFFVCTAPGRYARSPDEAAVVEPAVAGSSVVACVGTPAAEAKRGRGRPRKDGSSSASPAGKKDGSAVAPPAALPATPKRRGRRRGAAHLAADEGSVPTSSIAVADKKDESQATPSTPRRRRGLRKLAVATTTDGLGEALVADKRDSIGAPSTTDKEHGRSLELALVIIDGSATNSIVDKVCGEASPTTPVDRGQPREVALVTAATVPAPTTTTDKDGGEALSLNRALVAKHGEISTTSTLPERSNKACELALVVADEGSVPVVVADKDDGGEAPSAAYKRRRQSPRKAAPVAVAAHGTAPASTAAKKAAGGKVLLATPKSRRQQRKPALVATGSRSAPTPVAGKKTGSEVLPFATPKLTLVTAGGSSTPASVADKNGGNKPHILPRKLYPLTAEEVPDDPLFCLLALPAHMPAAANASLQNMAV